MVRSSLLVAMAACLAGQSAYADVSLKVTSDQGNQSSPYLYGAMFEEMDHSGDGGIHGQLLQNNGFQGSNPSLTAYKAIGDVDISRDTDHPVSHAITSSLQVSVSDATGFVGFANTGYGGVPVQKATYQTSFWMRGEYSGIVTVQLVGSESGSVYAAHNITVKSEQGRFKKFESRFESDAAPDGNNEWRVLVNADKVKGDGSVNFGLVELFPPTYMNRTNGLRDDVAKFLADTAPTFLRFPGGNNIEGLTIPQRWAWNQTIGPVVDRPGRQGDWFYPNTDALGLDEFMWWCEDMNMTAMLAVWAGKSYGRIVSGSELEPFVDDIMNELEYLLGSPDSTWGSLRAKNGRHDPWELKYVEIGNEDYLTGGCETYPDRFTQIYDAIHDKYPDINLIASTMEEECLPSPLPPNVMVDLHYYLYPDPLVSKFGQFDNSPRDRPIIVGEWGCRNTTAERGQFWGFMQGACSEAVNMIGFERNSDVVKMTTYSPMLQNFAFTQWSPTLFGLDSSPNSLTPSTSYFVQKMFAENLGHTILPMYSSVDFGPLYWVASKNDTHMQMKIVNYGEDEHSLNISMPNTRSGVLVVLSGGQYQGNTPHNVGILPETQDIQSTSEDGGIYDVEIAPWSVAVLGAELQTNLNDVWESSASALSSNHVVMLAASLLLGLWLS